MANEMKLKECAFYVVQYVPDLLRGEYLNIGLFLHSPEEKYLGCMFTDDLRRIKRFHPQSDSEFLRELQQDFEEQIDLHAADLDAFLKSMDESFSNLIQLESPRSCLLADPQAELQNIFERYVGRRLSGPPPTDTRLNVKQRLNSAFVHAGVWDQLEKRIPAEQWTKRGDPFAFDYGYRPLQNGGKPYGHIKLVHALSLKRDTDLAKVLAYTIARIRQREQAELTAVVESLAAPGNPAAQASQEILLEQRIELQALDGVNDYAARVRSELFA
jgi:Protein of unknown function (DUF3037)